MKSIKPFALFLGAAVFVAVTACGSEYNNERPHQGLGGLYPGELYTPSAREFFQPEEPEYPLHDRTIKVTRCGRICIGRRKINLSTVFAGQTVGLRE